MRLEDNKGLLEALEKSEEVLPIFIFDEDQIDKKKNEYFGNNAFQFMINSLKDLDKSLSSRKAKLFLFKGRYEKILEELLKNESIDAVFVNKDYTPFSVKRDEKMRDICDVLGIKFFRIEDYVLSPIEEIKTSTRKPYSVFTPFMKAARKHKVDKPRKDDLNNFYSKKISAKEIGLSKVKFKENKALMLSGGREEVVKMMKKTDFLEKYKSKRNLLSEEGTSRLSAHIKFGTVSIREVYYWAKENNAEDQFISELYWRDFYLHISYHFPKVFGESFQERGDRIKWINDIKQFKAWCEGETGVPIVDAGMRQLNKIGWMHNRVRMIVASYLTKNLLIDWRWGEKYFAQKLVDYDPSSNNGGWQWSASVGADPKPIRIFNPYTQAQKYDPKARYIKEWVSELAEVDRDLLVSGKEVDFSEYAKYPKPLVDQKESYHRAMEVYRNAK